MCEILIRVIDKVNHDDPVKNASLTKRGDVIVVCPDGHRWSDMEMTHKEWRIIAFPGVDETHMTEFLAPEFAGPDGDDSMLRPRAFKFDVDSHGLPADMVAHLDDERRQIPIIVAEMDRNTIHQFRARRPPLKAAVTANG
jgi:hypothetical protein